MESCVIDIDNRMIWIVPVIKSTTNDGDYLRIQTQGLAIKNAINTKVNKNMLITRYYTWPDHMNKPRIVRGSDDWCFMRRDGTYVSSVTVDNLKYGTRTGQLPHTKIIRSED